MLKIEYKYAQNHKFVSNAGIWYSGIMLASGARGPGFDSRNPPDLQGLGHIQGRWFQQTSTQLQITAVVAFTFFLLFLTPPPSPPLPLPHTHSSHFLSSSLFSESERRGLPPAAGLPLLCSFRRHLQGFFFPSSPRASLSTRLTTQVSFSTSTSAFLVYPSSLRYTPVLFELPPSACTAP